MKRIYANEKWCLGCHLCEYYCSFANSGIRNMVQALKDKKIFPRIRVEGDDRITFALSCRHCDDPLCMKACISGALHKEDGAVMIDYDRCVGCQSCILACPFGAIVQGENGVVQKCELCLKNSVGEPACVLGCPNHALVYQEHRQPKKSKRKGAAEK